MRQNKRQTIPLHATTKKILVGKVGPFRLAKTRAAHFDKKKEPETRTASRLSLVGKLVSLDWLKREPLISIKRKSLERELRPDSVWWCR